MRFGLWQGGGLLTLLPAFVLVVGGCSQADNKGGQAKDKATPAKDGGGQVAQKHDHGGWWCDEHGIPEDECSMCNAKVAAEFKKKGDWCDKHDRAMSQCFICNPNQKEFYAAKYRAKYGKEPPPIEESKDGDKK